VKLCRTHLKTRVRRVIVNPLIAGQNINHRPQRSVGAMGRLILPNDVTQKTRTYHRWDDKKLAAVMIG
jgi:hypothetical protein